MPRRRLSLTTRGAFAVGAAPTGAIAGLLLGAEELVLVALALGTLLVCGALQSAGRARRARGDWRVSVHLSVDEAEVGRPTSVAMILAATGPGGAVPVWLEDPGPCWRRVEKAPVPLRRGLPNPATAHAVPGLVPGATATFEFSVPTAHRGIYVLSGQRLWCFDSLGLWARLVGTGPSATVSVHPVPAAVELTDELLRGEAGPEEQQVYAAAPTRRDNFGDFAGIRQYVPGDRLRLLYWPALARTGELMVRDFEDAAPRRVMVVADVRPLNGYRGSEAVLAAVAGVGLEVLASGASLEVSTSSGERLAIAPGPEGPAALLRAIAAIESTPPPQRARRSRPQAPLVPPGQSHSFAPSGGAHLVVTTRTGAQTLPGALGFGQMIIAA